MFHKEGHYIIIVSFIITAMINLLSRSFIDNNTLIYSIGIVTIIILVLILESYYLKFDSETFSCYTT